jgi:hypothetical protein
MPHVVIWQAEFWRRWTEETFWMDFPDWVSEILEENKHVLDAKFEYSPLEEVPYMPNAKRARWEEGPDDNFVYWLFPGEMEQMNTVHGARRRLRRIFIEREELDRLSCWP